MKKKPEPTSKDRLTLLRVDKISYPKGADCPTVTVTFQYEPNCCSGQHEMIDALTAVYSLVKEEVK